MSHLLCLSQPFFIFMQSFLSLYTIGNILNGSVIVKNFPLNIPYGISAFSNEECFPVPLFPGRLQSYELSILFYRFKEFCSWIIRFISFLLQIALCELFK